MRYKYTIEFAKQFFKDNGCELLEEEYKGCKTLMAYRCSCNNISKISFDNFKNGYRCKKCGFEKIAKKKRFSFEYVYNFFKDNGCELLEKEYFSNNKPMFYKCKCSNISKIAFVKFKMGQRCKKCSGTEKFTFEYVKNYFENQGCKILSKRYIGNKTKIKYICKCGNIGKTSFADFRKGSRCPNCNKTKKYSFEYVKKYFKDNDYELLDKKYKRCDIKMKIKCDICKDISSIRFCCFLRGSRSCKCKNDKKKYTINEVKQFFKDNGCKLLEKKYKNVNYLMRYRCKCKKINKITFRSFIKGSRCRKCGDDKRRHKIEYIQQCFEKNNCILLSKKYKNNNTLLKYRCSCGNIDKINFSNFKKGQKCHKCAVLKRTGENNCRYNPLLTEQDRKDQRTRLSDNEYRIWRKKVFIRDNYSCIKCHNGGYINAHHIESWATNKKLRLVESNGITLCYTCHVKFHKKYGVTNNNKQQLDEYLQN